MSITFNIRAYSSRKTNKIYSISHHLNNHSSSWVKIAFWHLMESSLKIGSNSHQTLWIIACEVLKMLVTSTSKTLLVWACWLRRCNPTRFSTCPWLSSRSSKPFSRATRTQRDSRNLWSSYSQGSRLSYRSLVKLDKKSDRLRRS